MPSGMEASLRLRPPFSLQRYGPEERVGLSLVLLSPLIAQVEFDRRDLSGFSHSSTTAKQAIFGVVSAVSACLR